MIACDDSNRIHRWNAMDDLDDGTDDRINDDLINNNTNDTNDTNDVDPDHIIVDISSSECIVTDSHELYEDIAGYEVNRDGDEDEVIIAFVDNGYSGIVPVSSSDYGRRERERDLVPYNNNEIEIVLSSSSNNNNNNNNNNSNSNNNKFVPRGMVPYDNGNDNGIEMIESSQSSSLLDNKISAQKMVGWNDIHGIVSLVSKIGSQSKDGGSTIGGMVACTTDDRKYDYLEMGKPARGMVLYKNDNNDDSQIIVSSSSSSDRGMVVVAACDDDDDDDDDDGKDGKQRGGMVPYDDDMNDRKSARGMVPYSGGKGDTNPNSGNRKKGKQRGMVPISYEDGQDHYPPSPPLSCSSSAKVEADDKYWVDDDNNNNNNEDQQWKVWSPLPVNFKSPNTINKTKTKPTPTPPQPPNNNSTRRVDKHRKSSMKKKSSINSNNNNNDNEKNKNTIGVIVKRSSLNKSRNQNKDNSNSISSSSSKENNNSNSNSNNNNNNNSIGVIVKCSNLKKDRQRNSNSRSRISNSSTSNRRNIIANNNNAYRCINAISTTSTNPTSDVGGGGDGDGDGRSSSDDSNSNFINTYNNIVSSLDGNNIGSNRNNNNSNNNNNNTTTTPTSSGGVSSAISPSNSIYTSTNFDLDSDEEDTEDVLDDDINDNIDASRYTRSIHSMPVLEEVTEEESPLHSRSVNSDKSDKHHPFSLSSSPSSEIVPTTPTSSWVELRQALSPSPTASSKSKGSIGSSKTNNGGNITPTTDDEALFQCQREHVLARGLLCVETASTHSQSENGDGDGADASSQSIGNIDVEKGMVMTMMCWPLNNNNKKKGRQLLEEGDDDVEEGGKSLQKNSTTTPAVVVTPPWFCRKDYTTFAVIISIGIIVGCIAFLTLYLTIVYKGGEGGKNDNLGLISSESAEESSSSSGEFVSPWSDPTPIDTTIISNNNTWTVTSETTFFNNNSMVFNSIDNNNNDSKVDTDGDFDTATTTVSSATTTTSEEGRDDDKTSGGSSSSSISMTPSDSPIDSSSDANGSVGTTSSPTLSSPAVDVSAVITVPALTKPTNNNDTTAEDDSVSIALSSSTTQPPVVTVAVPVVEEGNTTTVATTTTTTTTRPLVPLPTSSPSSVPQQVVPVVVVEEATTTTSSPSSTPIQQIVPSQQPVIVATNTIIDSTPTTTNDDNGNNGNGDSNSNSNSTNSRMIPVIKDTDAIQGIIKKARRQIELLIFDDDSLIGSFLRLVFHDCVGGCDGCIDLTNPDNNGLDIPINILQPIVDEFTNVTTSSSSSSSNLLSRTDIWMLSSLVATEIALPFQNNDLLFPLHWIGRQTCEHKYSDQIEESVQQGQEGFCGLDFFGNPTKCEPTLGPHINQPHGSLGTKSIQDFFEEEFNFNPQQVTALMGAHSVGRMHRHNTGFDGTWDLSAGSLDGGYWLELIGDPPDYFLESIDNNDLPDIPNRKQWRGIINHGETDTATVAAEQKEQKTIAMLNVDIALVKNVLDMDETTGDVGCGEVNNQNLNDCSSETPFWPFANVYNGNNRKFLTDFRDVLNNLIDHGYNNIKPLGRKTICPNGRVCTFGFTHNDQKTDSETVVVIVEELSPPPTPSPSRSPPRMIPWMTNEKGIGGPKIELDRLCYDTVGENLVVTYNLFLEEQDLSVTDITMQVFDINNIEIVMLENEQEQDIILNPRVRNSPLISSLSCGEQYDTCHTWTSRGGLQISTTDLIGGGNDYGVLLLANTTTDDANINDNRLEILAGVSFRLGGCNE